MVNDADQLEEIEDVALHVRFDPSLVNEEFLAQRLLQLEGVEDVDVRML